MQALQDNNLGDRLSLKAAGRTLSIDSLPAGGNYGGVLVAVVDGAGREVFKDVYQRGQRIVFSPVLRASGAYRLCVYAGPAMDGRYHSWFGGSSGIPLLFDGRSLSFQAAPYMLANSKFVHDLPVSRTFLDECLEPDPDIQCGSAAIRALAAQIKKGRIFPESILLGVNDWVARNISYDMDALIGNRYRFDDNSALRVLETRRSVCGGYHNLTSAILRACGIPTVGVTCFALGRSTTGWWYDADNMNQDANHIMTAAYVRGRWRLMDVTWDSDLEYCRGRVVARSGLGPSRSYCDASIPYISLTHRFREYEV